MNYATNFLPEKPFETRKRRKAATKPARTTLSETLLGGSWVVIHGIISPLIQIINIVTLLITSLRTTHEPPSRRNSRSLGHVVQVLNLPSATPSHRDGPGLWGFQYFGGLGFGVWVDIMGFGFADQDSELGVWGDFGLKGVLELKVLGFRVYM